MERILSPEESFDLVLSDIRMPVIEGVIQKAFTLEEIRALVRDVLARPERNAPPPAA